MPEFFISNYSDMQSVMCSGMKYALKAILLVLEAITIYRSSFCRYSHDWNLVNSHHFSGVYFQCRCHVLQGLMGTIRATFQAGLHPEEDPWS